MRYLLSLILVLGFAGSAGGQPAETPTPAQKADKAVRSPSGTLVRVVGAAFDKDDAVATDTEVGDVVEVEVGARVLCNVVLYAKSVKRSEFHGDPDMRGATADVPGLKDHFGKASRPVPVPGTCDAEGVCAWNVLLAGDACRLVGDSPHFVASTLREMWDLPSVRARMLVTDGTCKDDEGEDVGCAVRVGDPRTVSGRNVRFGHNWAGRFQDLNFRQRLKGKYLDRVRPDRL